MSKYEKINNNVNEIKIESILSENETVIWKGKPKKWAFFLTKTLGMMPIALLWLAFDSVFIFAVFQESGTMVLIPALAFIAFHLMPVWIWLYNVFTANKIWQNTEYAVTDKRIIFKTGFIGSDIQTLYYKDIKNVRLNIGIIDKMLGVGDIYFLTESNVQQAFFDIVNPYEIYPKIQKTVLDIQTDIEYPNDLRPKSNSGYNTKYEPKN